MIAYTELRPGNYVNALHKGKKKKFLKITLEDICQIRDSALDVFPVPIAGEWLDKFGFAHNTTFVHFKLSPFYFVQDTEGWFFKKHEIKINQHPLLYIHQLQNFFYCFTGEELDIK
jgi:hypothetical protein